MARPAVTDPPGELMYSVMALSGLSASSQRSWATMAAETVSSTSPLRQTIRSCILLDWSSPEKERKGRTCNSFEKTSAATRQSRKLLRHCMIVHVRQPPP